MSYSLKLARDCAETATRLHHVAQEWQDRQFEMNQHLMGRCEEMDLNFVDIAGRDEYPVCPWCDSKIATDDEIDVMTGQVVAAAKAYRRAQVTEAVAWSKHYADAHPMWLRSHAGEACPPCLGNGGMWTCE